GEILDAVRHVSKVAHRRQSVVVRGDDFKIVRSDDPESGARPTIPGAARRSVEGMRSTSEGVTMNAAISAALSDERVLLDHSPPAVAAREVKRRYGEGDTAVDALRGVSLEVRRGELTAVMGPSGSGKSTLMHILTGLDRPTSGSVQIDGIEIATLKDNDLTKLRRQHIGFVFQFFNLLPMLTAEENVTLPLTLSGRKPEPGWLEELFE